MAPGVATMLASSAAALLLDVALRHVGRLVAEALRHVGRPVVEAEVVPAAFPPSPQVPAVEEPDEPIVKWDGWWLLVGVETEEKVNQLPERGQALVPEHHLDAPLELVPGASLPVFEVIRRPLVPEVAQSYDDFVD